MKKPEEGTAAANNETAKEPETSLLLTGIVTAKRPEPDRKERDELESAEIQLHFDDYEPQSLEPPSGVQFTTHGVGIHFLMQVLAAGVNLDYFLQRETGNTRNTATNYKKEDKTRQLSFTHDKKYILTFGCSNVDIISKFNKGNKKLLAFIMSLIADQAFKNGKMITDTVVFNLDDLVTLKMYTNTQNARRAVKEAVLAFRTLYIDYQTKSSKRKQKNGSEPKITGALGGFVDGVQFLRGGACHIKLGSTINWEPLIQGYSQIPEWAYSLSNRAFDLLFYTYTYLGRQRSKRNALAEQGFYPISFAAVQKELLLPQIGETDKPARDIRDVMLKAAAEINETAAQVGAGELLHLDPVNAARNVSAFLAKGYFQVQISGTYAKTFLALAQKDEKTANDETDDNNDE